MTLVKRVRILIASGVAGLAMVGGGLVFNYVHAQPADANQKRLQIVSERCELLKTRLQSVEKTDTAARIKRGRAYDQELIPYISAFNSRVAVNKVDAPELIRIAADLQEAAGAQFSRLYTVYADDLENAIRSDCVNSPSETYGWIQKARTDRAAAAQQVTKIDSLIGEYITELKKLERRFTPAINKPGEDTP